ncbi:pre-peptidase C-terminal domain-containing protein [Aurantiacibacter flavus]|uniref:Pre-peptidase C-terminal domain-containing protein n=1 Tax=Aurantiacibacter flavus TaxID=3145232 RepID=A0ABV0CY76_9SPHN
MKSVILGKTAMAAILCAGLAAPGAAQELISSRGELRSGDEELPSGELYDVYYFDGNAGDEIDVTLTSSDFDAYLMLRNDGDFSVENDDAEGDTSTNSRITATLPEDGRYRFVITSFEPGETGAYRLQGTNGVAGAFTDSISGTLSPSDSTLEDGSYYDRYTFAGRRGQHVSLRMTSTDFDTYLRVESPSGETFSNDDGDDGSTNSQLDLDLTESGRYQLIANSLTSDETGSYELIIEGAQLSSSESSDSSAAGGAATSLTLGTPARGQLAAGDAELDSGEFFDVFTLRGTPGARVVVTMQSSEFDTYLGAVGANDFSAENDDDPNGGGTDSRLELTIPADGALTIAATSYAGAETGHYTIRADLSGSSTRAASDQRLELGRSVNGTLAASDPRGDHSVEDVYLIEASAGQSLRLALTSEDFDSLLRVEGPGGFSVENDDDPAGSTLNSLVETTLPRDGTYRVVVASYSEGGLGSYRLDSGTTASSSLNGLTRLTLGSSVSGSLASGDDTIPSGEFIDAYSFAGQRGQRVTFDMTSSEFDTYLSLLMPGGGTEENDDRAGGDGETNSRLTVTLPETGTYTLVATSYQDGETGRYTISSSVSTGGGNAPVLAGRSGGRIFALSVGVADYGGRAGNLSMTDQDATKLTQTLQHTGMLAQQSATLINQQATRENFIEAISEIAGTIGPDDLFLLFYSGHGAKQRVESFMERDGTSETIELFDAAVTDYELARMLEPIHARTLLVLDSCFSGGFDDVINRQTGRMGVFSSDSDLTSLVAQKFQAGGYISHILQQAMEGRADANGDGAITAGELSEFMRTTFYRIALDEPLQTTAYGASGTRSQGYQHIVVNRGGDGMPYDEVLVTLASR